MVQSLVLALVAFGAACSSEEPKRVASLAFDSDGADGLPLPGGIEPVVIEVGLGFDVGDLDGDFFASDFDCEIQGGTAPARMLELAASSSARTSSRFRTIWRVVVPEAAGILFCRHTLDASVPLRADFWTSES